MPWIQKGNQLTLGEVTALVKGELIGDDQSVIRGICSIEEQQPGAIAFSKAESRIALGKLISNCECRALIIKRSAKLPESDTELNFIRVDDPLAAIVGLIPYFFEPLQPERTISTQADIDPSATIGTNVHIGAFCSLGKSVSIGDGAVLYPGVILYPEVTIGKNCVLHSGVTVREFCEISDESVVQNGATIGTDGFGYYQDESGLQPVPQVGTAVLGKKVDVGANSCIDRGAFGRTVISDSAKIDNLVQVGHNVQLGFSSIVCGHTAIGGSTKIGAGATLGGRVGVADHTTIESGARLGGGTGAIQATYPKGDYAGYPPRPALAWRKEQAALTKLPELLKRMNRVEKKLD